jgi:bifunctional non-homologous end joining protein LigD
VVRTRHGTQLHVPELDSLGDALHGRDALFDGELIHGAGRMDDFYPLAGQVSARRREQPLRVGVFDVLELDGEHVWRRPTEHRRDVLEMLELHDAEHSFVVPRWDSASLDAVMAECERTGLEGVVWKAARSVYRPGVRSNTWRKLKTPGWQQHARRRISS